MVKREGRGPKPPVADGEEEERVAPEVEAQIGAEVEEELDEEPVSSIWGAGRSVSSGYLSIIQGTPEGRRGRVTDELASEYAASMVATDFIILDLLKDMRPADKAVRARAIFANICSLFFFPEDSDRGKFVQRLVGEFAVKPKLARATLLKKYKEKFIQDLGTVTKAQQRRQKDVAAHRAAETARPPIETPKESAKPDSATPANLAELLVAVRRGEMRPTVRKMIGDELLEKSKPRRPKIEKPVQEPKPEPERNIEDLYSPAKVYKDLESFARAWGKDTFEDLHGRDMGGKNPGAMCSDGKIHSFYVYLSKAAEAILGEPLPVGWATIILDELKKLARAYLAEQQDK